VKLAVTRKQPFRQEVADNLPEKGSEIEFLSSSSSTNATIVAGWFTKFRQGSHVSFHSHGAEADRALCDLKPEILKLARRAQVAVCFAITFHGEVEQFIGDLKNNPNDQGASNHLKYFKHILAGHDVFFAVAPKNIDKPYEDKRFNEIVQRRNVRSKTFPIKNGVSPVNALDRLPSALDTMQKRGTTFVVASRADDKCKGHLLTARMIRQLREAGEDCQAVLMGDGRALADVQNYVQQNNLGNRVFLLGQVTSAQAVMRSLVRSTRTGKVYHLLATNCLEESHPVSIADAHAARIPTVSVDIPGSAISDMIGNSGFLVNLSSNNRDEAGRHTVSETGLYAVMVRCCQSSSDEYDAKAELARATYEKHHRLEAMVKEYERHYVYNVPAGSASS